MSNEQLFKVGDVVVLSWTIGGETTVQITETPAERYPYYEYKTIQGINRGNTRFHCNCTMLREGNIKKLPEIKAILYRRKV